MSGKNVWFIVSGNDLTPPDGFEVPFARTAQYFGMHHRGSGYLFSGINIEARQSSESALAALGQRVLALHEPKLSE
jgi:hypothetical protein